MKELLTSFIARVTVLPQLNFFIEFFCIDLGNILYHNSNILGIVLTKELLIISRVLKDDCLAQMLD